MCVPFSSRVPRRKGELKREKKNKKWKKKNKSSTRYFLLAINYTLLQTVYGEGYFFSPFHNPSPARLVARETESKKTAVFVLPTRKCQTEHYFDHPTHRMQLLGF